MLAKHIKKQDQEIEKVLGAVLDKIRRSIAEK
jgi:hypothetical protein